MIFFGLDTWRVTPNFTLNYGLRYELNTVLHDAHPTKQPTGIQQTSRHIFPRTSIRPISPSLNPQGSRLRVKVGLYAPDHNNFAPRIGISWNPQRMPNTVIRAAYGVFYDTVLGNLPANVSLNPPAMPDYYTQVRLGRRPLDPRDFL